MCPDYEAFGISLDGGFEEYLRVPGFALGRGTVFHVPDGVGYAASDEHLADYRYSNRQRS
jgi:threonine dehydrogenase-like Zn-dependent dehydrogenase